MFLPLSSLILSHLVAALCWYYFVRWEACKNAADIAADGPANTLGDAYHARRSRIRAAVATPLTLAPGMLLQVVSLPHNVVVSATLSSVALLVLFTTYFAYEFNPALSRLRGKDPYYVSFSPTAARWPDRYLAAKTNDPAEASRLLKNLLATTYRLGLTCYALLLAGAGALLFLK